MLMCAVSASDFPTSDFVRRRLQLFQKSFVSSVTRLYSSLTLDVRLSCLALAVRALSDKYVRVTLADFLQTKSDDHATQLSSDFLDQCAAGRTDFVACVPDALFPGITHARNDKVLDYGMIAVQCVERAGIRTGARLKSESRCLPANVQGQSVLQSMLVLIYRALVQGSRS